MPHTAQTPLDIDHINPALKRYALRLTKDPVRAEDLVQDTYMSMLVRATPQKGIEKPDQYMMSVMHNLFIDGTRAAARDLGRVSLENVTATAPDAPQSLKLACKEIVAAIADLPEDHQEVLQRLVSRGQSYTEISRDLGVPLGTVMSRVARARASLYQILGVNTVTSLLEGA